MGSQSQRQTQQSAPMCCEQHLLAGNPTRILQAAMAATLCCCAWLLLAIPSVASGISARTARIVDVRDTAYLKRKPTKSDEILEEGPVYGTLPGTVRVYLNVGATVIAHFTIDTGGSSISGVGSGKLKGRPVEPSFNGRMSVNHGTGRYAHAHGEGGFSGTINRETFHAVVQTSGALSY